MSTDSATEDTRGRRRDLAGRLVRAILPAVAAAALGASLLAGDLGAVYELRAIAPREALPGSRLPVRAVVFSGEDELTGGPVEADVRVFLDDPASGFRTEPRRLDRSLVLGAEGQIALPERSPSAVTLVVEASLPAGARVRATRRVRIRDDAARPQRRSPPRTDLERLALGPIRAEGEGGPLERLDVEIPSGSCVPELPCRVSISSEPPLALAIEPALGVEVVDQSGADATIVVRGPEGTLELVASREGRVVARRDVRLPLSPGGIAVDVRSPEVPPGGTPTVLVRTLEDGPLAVDLFVDGRWAQATSMRGRAGRATPVPPLALGAGAHRVQVQRHVFSPDAVDRAGIGVFMVGEPGALATEHTDEVVVPPDPFAATSTTRVALDRARERGRLAAAVLILASGLAAFGLLLRRGVGAAGYAVLVLLAFGTIAAFAWVVR